MISDLPRVRRDLIVKEIAGELLVYDEVSAKAFCLNESAAAIWGMCDGSTTISEMTRRTASWFGALIDEDFVMCALVRFGEDGLLENEYVGARPVVGVTRAELVSRAGRVGLAAVAVPLVMSIVAPTAAKAYGRRGDDNDDDRNRDRDHERDEKRGR